MIHHIYAPGQEVVDLSVRLVNLSEKSDCISNSCLLLVTQLLQGNPRKTTPKGPNNLGVQSRKISKTLLIKPGLALHGQKVQSVIGD